MHSHRGARFSKAEDPQAARVRKLVEKLAGPIRRAFEAFVKRATSDEALREVADEIERGNIARALAMVDAHFVPVADLVAQAYVEAGIEEMKALEEQAGPIFPAVGVSFDPSNPRAAAAMQETRFNLIRDMSTTQRRTIEQALTRAQMEGTGTQGTARAFKEAIGLTSRQEEAVANYRRLLQSGDTSAVNRALADGYNWNADRKANLRRQIAESRLSPGRIDNMVERYRRRFIAYRAETIARTQATTAASMAQEEATAQLVDLGFSPDLIMRVWHTTMDGRERFTHAMLNGEEKPMGKPFKSESGAEIMYPGDPDAPAEERINCRCVLTNRILRNAPPE